MLVKWREENTECTTCHHRRTEEKNEVEPIQELRKPWVLSGVEHKQVSRLQKPYYRDIWALSPPNTGYPGAFPRGLIPRVRRKWWGNNRLWLFSGGYITDDITVDIKEELKPEVVANCEILPFKDNSFDFVFADPPYSQEESMVLYQLPYVNIIKTINEMVRVCKPGGYLLFLHRLVPEVFPGMELNKQTSLEGIVGIFTIAGLSNIRALSVRRKNNTFAEWG